MTAEELKQHKAKQLRYKKPIAKCMNMDYIYEQIGAMEDAIYDVQWFVDDEDSLTNALAGDEEEAYEFRMAFSDLAAELERFREDLNNEYVPDCFDDLFPAVGADFFGGYLGFDSYEGDYFGLSSYEGELAEGEAEKRVCRMTKKELLDAVRCCLKVYASYTALQYRCDCLEASLDIIRGQNLERLKLVKEIEEQYEKAETASEHFRYEYNPEVRKLNAMLANVPPEYWL